MPTPRCRSAAANPSKTALLHYALAGMPVSPCVSTTCGPVVRGPGAGEQAGPVDVQWDGRYDLGSAPDRRVSSPATRWRQARQYTKLGDPVIVRCRGLARGPSARIAVNAAAVLWRRPASVRADVDTQAIHIGFAFNKRSQGEARFDRESERIQLQLQRVCPRRQMLPLHGRKLRALGPVAARFRIALELDHEPHPYLSVQCRAGAPPSRHCPTATPYWLLA